MFIGQDPEAKAACSLKFILVNLSNFYLLVLRQILSVRPRLALGSEICLPLAPKCYIKAWATMPGTLDCFSDVSPTQGDFHLTSSHTFWLQPRATIFLTVRVSDSLRNNGCSRTQERLNITGTSPHHFFCFVFLLFSASLIYVSYRFWIILENMCIS